MKKLTTKTLENAIVSYETTLKVTGDNSEYCYGALDKVTVEFLKELKEYRDAEEQGLLVKIECRCNDCVHVDYAGCRGKTVYCMKHEAYMNEDDFCGHAEKMKGEEHESV